MTYEEWLEQRADYVSHLHPCPFHPFNRALQEGTACLPRIKSNAWARHSKFLHQNCIKNIIPLTYITFLLYFLE